MTRDEFVKEFESLIERVKKEEGFTEQAYWDRTHYSIGYGTPAKNKYETITEQDAEIELIEHLYKAFLQYDKHFDRRRFNKVREDAMIDMIYNLGIGGVLNFKNMCYELKQTYIDWIHVAYHAYDSRWFWQVGSRARRIVKEFAEGK